MPEKIRFHFDPICPWSFQTARWIRHVAALGACELTWGLFSLELQNADSEPERLAKAHAKSALALRTGAAVREAAGSDALGDFYASIGHRVHVRREPLDDAGTVRSALEDAQLDTGLVELAAAEHRFEEVVVHEHRELVERTRSFGVPTLILDNGDGPAIFGPVIARAPEEDDEALQLFDHVVWLARYENFAELKRERVGGPVFEEAPAPTRG